MPSRRSRARRNAANAAAGHGQGSAGAPASGQASLAAASAADIAAQLLTAAGAGDTARLQRLLRQHPGVLDAASGAGAAALMEAVRQQHQGCVAALLSAGVDPNSAGEDGVLALQLAASSHSADCLQALLDAGAAPNAASGEELLTAAHRAAAASSFHCLKALLAAGANLAAGDAADSQPIHYLCDGSKTDDSGRCAELLLSAGCAPNCRDSLSGFEPLHCAMHEKGSLEVVSALLYAGADPNAADDNGVTPLHVAATHHAPANLVRELVLGGASLDRTNSHGRTALEVGCANPHFAAAVLQAVQELAELLDDSGCFDLRTPLHRAAACNQPGVLRALLSQGHSPDAVPASSWTQATPLIVAAQLGHAACVRELLAAPADTGAADLAGNTATYYAAELGHWHCLRRLLAAGAACDQPCEGGATALHAAAWEGEEACMLALLEAGASIDSTDEQGLTALQLAAINGQEHCVCTLLLAGAALPTSFPGVEAEAAGHAQALIQEAAEQLGLLPAPAAAGDSEGNAAAAALASPAAPAAAAATPNRAALDDGLLSDVCCPITHEVMQDPVLAADGTTYERQAIEAWIARQQAAGQAPSSPATNLPLAHTNLTENRIARALIASLRTAGLLSG